MAPRFQNSRSWSECYVSKLASERSRLDSLDSIPTTFRRGMTSISTVHLVTAVAKSTATEKHLLGISVMFWFCMRHLLLRWLGKSMSEPPVCRQYHPLALTTQRLAQGASQDFRIFEKPLNRLSFRTWSPYSHRSFRGISRTLVTCVSRSHECADDHYNIYRSLLNLDL